MQKKSFDVESHLRQTRAGETLFAFAGLIVFPDSDDPECECSGMFKVTRVLFADGSGKLCCHFILDLEKKTLREKVGRLFQDLSNRALEMHLGQDFEYLSPVESLELDDSLWYGLTLTFSFKTMQNCSGNFVSNRIIPALEQRLPMRFQEVQLWQGDGTAENRDWIGKALRAHTKR